RGRAIRNAALERHRGQIPPSPRTRFHVGRRPPAGVSLEPDRIGYRGGRRPLPGPCVLLPQCDLPRPFGPSVAPRPPPPYPPPDLAARRWRRVRRALTGPRQRRALWPVDVGNYGFTRAASYAMTAAAAAEMGDTEMATRMLDLLDAEHPAQLASGVVHRDRSSLWAHAVELIARLAQAGTLRRLVATPRRRAATDPYIASAAYPDVLVAEARVDRGALRAVLHAGTKPGAKILEIAGLVPTCGYIAEAETAWAQCFTADASGAATLRIPVRGRTALRIVPAA